MNKEAAVYQLRTFTEDSAAELEALRQLWARSQTHGVRSGINRELRCPVKWD
jgi:hypothetical protein